MGSEGRPKCPVESCDGDLYREFKTGLNQSTAQMMRWGAVALFVVPVVMGAPFLIEGIRGSATTLVAALLGIGIPAAAGIALLRYRSRRLAERSEQQRCNKCGTVFPAATGG